MEITATDFVNREELETYIKSQLDTDPTTKVVHKIVGTVGQLRRLHLKEGKTVLGIPVSSLDKSASKTKKELVRVNRGRTFAPAQIKQSKEARGIIKRSKEV